MEQDLKVCSVCGAAEPPYWKDQPFNTTLIEYVREYIPPPRIFHLTLTDAMAEWGTTIQPEDLI